MGDSDWLESEDTVLQDFHQQQQQRVRSSGESGELDSRTGCRTFVPSGEGRRRRGVGRGFSGGERRVREEGNWRDRSNGGGGMGMKVKVNTQDVGRIIGRGGSKIKELEEESGARINVLKNVDAGYGMTYIEISGSDHNKETARKLIEDLTGGFSEESENPRRDQQDYRAPAIDWSAIHARHEIDKVKKWEGLAPIAKNFYQEDVIVGALSEEEVAMFRKENNNIKVQNLGNSKDRLIPNPVRTFSEGFGSYSEILDEMEKAGFEKPTPIQCQGWPVVMQGLDMVGIAQTGTGKTLVFLLPGFIHIMGQPVPREKRHGPTVLILSPTRELALQIQSEVEKYQYKGIKCVCIYGGGDRRQQIDALSAGVEIVVATPGRLDDLTMNGVVSLKSVTYLVLDEADRMLDMGFEPQIRKILLDIRPDRQTLMTSATWPPGVRDLAECYLTDPVQINVGSLDLAAVHSVTQLVEFIDGSEKKFRVKQFIRSMQENEKVLVFVGRKTTADDVASDFMLDGICCQCIHGDREQCDREQALDDFKTGVVKVLIATDVASRGIDIKDVTFVVNYDFPSHVEEYVHRVGRTGRAGRTGKSLTFMTREDWRHAQELIDILAEASQEVPDELVAMAERFQAHRNRMRADRDACRDMERRFRGDGDRPRRGGGRGGRGGRGGDRRWGGQESRGGRRGGRYGRTSEVSDGGWWL
ncbi:probable ATP-dependent RNA helicase DDX43 [Corticium candelabrum]|uniref:probable ATP-dependent RNA helicase DDX43 n=1 Tax=Corticium candelabrum TaxID=121492 RepID=UPI002E25F702|nr:probable ATP-dependent RNA helicase DDX43 [Corticium candelabrum]